MIILKGIKVNRMLDLDTMTLKMRIEMIMRLLRVETLHMKIRRVKKTLNGFR